MRRDTKIQLGAILIAAISLAASAAVAVQLTASTGRNKLSYSDTAEAGQPPQVALGIAMGAFRGVFVNFLWMRANDLKQDGRYYEAIELADAITKLQPRFPRVWVFHAWNMAYNISVATQTVDERWQWVQAGIRLLRDQGLRYNPNDMLIHKELAWIYLHKIQGYTDEANNYYKQRVAKEWTDILGAPPRPEPGDRSRAAAIDRYVQWLRVIADAPESLADAAKAEPSVTTLVDRLKAEVGVEPGFELLQRYTYADAVRKSQGKAVIQGAGFGPRMRALAALMDDPSLKAAWEAALPVIRKRVLVDEYSMEPLRMIRYTQLYGPIDWRNAAAHALYWSARGVEQAGKIITEQNEKDFDFLNTDRIVVQSVQELYRTGEMYFDYIFADLVTAPNPHFVETYGNILKTVVERSWADSDRRAYSFYAAGYENFINDAIRFFYRRGQLEEAEKWYRYMAVYQGQNLNNPERPLDYSVPLAEFVERQLFDRYTSPQVALSEVVGSLSGAYISGLLGGDGELFRRQFEYAKRFHRYFMEQQLRRTAVAVDAPRMAQMNPDFRQLAGDIFAQMISTLTIDDAQRVYENAPEDLRLFGYDILESQFRKGLEEDRARGGKSFDELFPAPQDIEEFRAAMQAERERQDSQLRVAPK